MGASTSLGLNLMDTGTNTGTWGSVTNVNLGTLLEQAITGNIQIAKSGTTDYTLSSTDYVSNETRNVLIEFTGTPGGAFNVIVPDHKKFWVFKNATDGVMTIKTSGGSVTVAVPVGASKWVYCDGAAHIYDVLSYFFNSTSTAFSPTAIDAQTLGTASLQWGDLFLANGGTINFDNGDVTLTHSANALAFAGATNGYTFSNVIKPASNDGAALGVSGTAFSDLFLASGGVINFDADDVTITHSANTLAFAGATSYTFDNVVAVTGSVTINGGAAYHVGGTDVALADGGTGASLSDPNADRIMFWDDSAGQVTWLTAGTGLSITDTTLSVDISSPFTAVITGAASNTQTFNATGTWTKPNTGTYAVIYAWGGGGGATEIGNNNVGGGGGGGAFVAAVVPLDSLAATETATVGAGGKGSNKAGEFPGGASTFGNYVTAYGGLSATNQLAGPGAGLSSVGDQGTLNANGIRLTPGTGGTADFTPFTKFGRPVVTPSDQPTPSSNAVGYASILSTIGGVGGNAGDWTTVGLTGGNAVYGGGGGGATFNNNNAGGGGGNSIWGGGGGGARSQNTNSAGGTSTYGGAGGAGSTSAVTSAGVQPGGGAGAMENANVNFTTGGAGKIVVYVY